MLCIMHITICQKSITSHKYAQLSHYDWYTFYCWICIAVRLPRYKSQDHKLKNVITLGFDIQWIKTLICHRWVLNMWRHDQPTDQVCTDTALSVVKWTINSLCVSQPFFKKTLFCYHQGLFSCANQALRMCCNSFIDVQATISWIK